MISLSTITSLVVESLSQPGVNGFAIFAMMAGAAAVAEIDRSPLYTTLLVWAIAPALWGAFLFAESGSLLLASVGAFALWFGPSFGFVFTGLAILAFTISSYHWLFTEPQVE